MSGAGAWGPVAHGGPGRRGLRRAGAVVLSLGVVGVSALASVGALAVQAATENLEQVGLDGLDLVDGGPLNVLVVGSDARGDLTAEEIRDLSLGDFAGQRSDTVMLVSVSADRSTVSIVSMPRDTVVTDTDGGLAKLTETYGDGRDALVRVVQEDLGFAVNHYVEVSIGGFISTVEVVGGVRLCLEEPLYDEKSGADFEAGCQEMTPAEALSYVRSRRGGLGDFDRIARQQQFLRAMLARIVDLRLLLEPDRLRDVAVEVSRNVTTDDQLDLLQMARLAQSLQGALGGGVEMITVPGFTRGLSDSGVTKSFVVPYEPGLAAMRAAIAAGEPLPSHGSRDERADVRIGLWTGDRGNAASVVESTLVWGGYQPFVLGAGSLDAGATTTVVSVPGFEQEAAWVAAHLGAPVVELPAGTEVRDDVEVIVAVGDDADF